MKIKTSELTGPALDWAVALIEKPGVTGCTKGRLMVVGNIAYSPSDYWSQGGPIIDREDITVGPWDTSPAMAQAKGWPSAAPRMVGPTKLIAAMRCFVASKLGDEVDVPEELLS